MQDFDPKRPDMLEPVKKEIQREVKKDLVQEQILETLTTISKQLESILEHLKSSK